MDSVALYTSQRRTGNAIDSPRENLAPEVCYAKQAVLFNEM